MDMLISICIAGALYFILTRFFCKGITLYSICTVLIVMSLYLTNTVNELSDWAYFGVIIGAVASIMKSDKNIN
ncbi:hypothetical protein HWV03_10245 [Moritella sp. 36]|uniref:hypothetical protein n=1 Tax=Moritella sp. 36 TaxID=2746233 RepID=UPI001BAC4E13|nr:hypothetical protein [Moritella sp. 36]QUM89151.1 hypothetical protein HWV03_10245 [Moritella sp. 36]